MAGSYDMPLPPLSKDTPTPALLSNLPSRGFFSPTVYAPNMGGMRVYVCEHDTSPPNGQLIRTNQTNILIRSLKLVNQKAELGSKKGKDVVSTDVSRKRPAGRAVDGRSYTKKRTDYEFISPPPEGSSSNTSDKDWYSLTVERLRTILRAHGLSTKGKKDVLVSRLRNANVEKVRS